jgi:hypothetical protein
VKSISFSFCALAFATSLHLAPHEGIIAASSSFSYLPRGTIALNHRILAKVNNKPITTLDLVKKMDLAFYQLYRGAKPPASYRLAFYQESWRSFLDKMIEEELVLAEAENRKQTVSLPEVRKEIEEEFGPNVHQSILEAGLTYQEVIEMVTRSLTLEKMTGVWHWKVEAEITPAKLIEAYQEENATSQNNTVYHFAVITIRGESEPELDKVANLLYSTIHENIGLLRNEETADLIISEAIEEQKGLLSQGMTLSLSKTYDQNSKELNPEWATVLEALGDGQISQPISMRSARDKGGVWRLFYLKKAERTQPLEFSQMEGALRNHLREKAFTDVHKEALERLKRAQAVEIDADILKPSFTIIRAN